MRLEEQPRVLVVDDDDNNLLAYSAILQGLNSQLVTARSGREALKAVLREEFAVIIMDVNMPGLDGFETAALIRQRAKSQATPLIFATASFNKESQVFRGYSLGAVDYLIKPLVPEVLRSKISVFIELFRKSWQIIRQAEDLRAAEQREHQELLRQEKENWETERLRQELNAEKEHHESMRRLNNELENRLLQLDQANRDLAQKNQENEMFVYSASHDLRSPLINLQAFSQELGSMRREIREIFAACDWSEEARKRGLSILDDGMSESIGFIQAAVTRLSTIINALLRLSRAGRVEYERQEVDVQGLVERIVRSMDSVIVQRQAKLSFKDLPPAWGDPTAIEQVFANLIGNALNYLDPARAGAIEIGAMDVAQHDQVTSLIPHIVYYVKDNGLGIPAAHQPQVFQAFKRLHPDAAPGEGMGLAMVQRIVERHDGKVWLESQAGVGTVFYVALPSSPAFVVTGGRDNTNGRQSEQERSFSHERTADYSLS